MSRKIKQWSRTEIELIDKDIRTDIKEILNVRKKVEGSINIMRKEKAIKRLKSNF